MNELRLVFFLICMLYAKKIKKNMRKLILLLTWVLNVKDETNKIF